jgi:hypothetical protein
MEHSFFACEVPADQTKTVEIIENTILVLSQGILGKDAKDGERYFLQASKDGETFVVCTLSTNSPQQPIKITLEPGTLDLKVIGKSSIHVTGNFDFPDEDDGEGFSDFDDEDGETFSDMGELSDEDDEAEPKLVEAPKGKIVEITDGKKRPREDDKGNQAKKQRPDQKPQGQGQKPAFQKAGGQGRGKGPQGGKPQGPGQKFNPGQKQGGQGRGGKKQANKPTN